MPDLAFGADDGTPDGELGVPAVRAHVASGVELAVPAERKERRREPLRVVPVLDGQPIEDRRSEERRVSPLLVPAMLVVLDHPPEVLFRLVRRLDRIAELEVVKLAREAKDHREHGVLIGARS